MFSLSMSAPVKATSNEIVEFSFQQLEDSKYSKKPYISFEVGQTCGLKVTTVTKNSFSSGYLRGNEGFTFSSNDTSIVTVGKTDGIMKGIKEGTTSVIASYPNLKSITIQVTIIATRTGKAAQKDHEAIKAIDEFSDLKPTADNIIDYYNKLRTLNESTMTKKEHFMNVPNEYRITNARIKLGEFLSSQQALFYSNNPIKVLKITKLTSDSMTVQLDRKISKADLAAYSGAYNLECKADMKITVGLYIYTGNIDPLSKGSQRVALVETDLSQGDDTMSIKVRNVLKSNKTYYVGFYYSDPFNDYRVTEGLKFTAR
jgi:hypothetical protein